MTNVLQDAPPIAPARRGLAVTALVLGLIAILTAAVPVLGAVVGVAAIIFGAVALKKRQPKGFSMTGLILGILATITSVIVTIVLVVMAGNLFAALEEGISDDGVSDERQEQGSEQPGLVAEEVDDDDQAETGPGGSFDRIAWDAFDVADAPASTHAGTEEDPHPIGSRFTVEDKWEVVVNMVDGDAYEHLMALAPENTPAPEGKRYVLVNLTVKNLSAEPAKVGNLSVYYDVPGQLHSAGRPGAVTPDPALFGKGLQITGNYTGYSAYLTKDLDGEFLRFAEWETKKHIFAALD